MITILQLVARPDLDLTLLAGAEGGQRIVTWAHAVDLPDPWNWVRPGDLVMTTGDGLPADPDEHSEWISRLSDANASGLVIARRPEAPRLSQAALDHADERSFPVLGADFDLEFAQLGRVIIQSALESQRHRLAASERVFSVYADSLRLDMSLDQRLTHIGRRFGWHLEVRPGPAEEEALPGSVRVDVPGRLEAVLMARSIDPQSIDDVADPLLIHYLAGLIGVEMERAAIERDDLRTDGADLLRAAVEGRLDLTVATAALERRGLTGDLVVVAIDPAGSASWPVEDVHHHPALRGLAVPFLDDGDAVLAVLPADEAMIDMVTQAVGDTSHAGVSDVLISLSDLVPAVRQARLALTQAHETGQSRAQYGGTRIASLIPDTVTEAAALAHRHLDPLLEHDRSHGTELVETVETFLAHDSAWKQTAEALHIHRQTLVYRLKSVERLTGVKPTSTEGTASLWLAIKAGRASGVVRDRSDGSAASHTSGRTD